MRPYPFTAVVGMADLRLALILSTISPAVGGVLVRGEKGTAKSTMVRALSGLLPELDVVTNCRFACDPAAPDPDCPDGPHAEQATSTTRPTRLVELPVGAAEERVIGSLNLERVLSEGVTDYQPGLLAGAHRGLLYVDEVNLLHDHLVDALLDAAAMGRATVEREGVSVSHAARFVLIGTMNPEEGELRPQLLDRFGLTVDVSASHEADERVEVIRRRLSYESDPDSFAAGYADSDAAVAEDIAAAAQLLPSVRLGDSALRGIAEVCASFDVDGMRADIVTARTAVAYAAWCGRGEVTAEDVRVAARLAIPHRRRRDPLDEAGMDPEQLEQALRDAGVDDQPDDGSATDDSTTDGGSHDDGSGGSDNRPDGPDDDPDGRGPDDDGPDDDGPDGDGPDDDGPGGGPGGGAPHPQQGNSTGNGQQGEHRPAEANEDTTGDERQPAASSQRAVDADAPYRAKLFAVRGTGEGARGRRSPSVTDTGRTVGYRPARETDTSNGAPHLLGTVLAAAPWQQYRRQAGRGLALREKDLRFAVREGKESNLVLFCVDASGSMGAVARMREVKSAVLSLLLDAYQRRDKVGLVTFRAGKAELALPPTTSVDVAAARLRELTTGGRTPVAEGLLRSGEVLRNESFRDPRRRPLLVVVTDGRATSGVDPVGRSQAAARSIAARGTSSVVMDCETGRMCLGLAAELAGELGAEHVPLGEVAAERLDGEVRSRTGRAA